MRFIGIHSKIHEIRVSKPYTEPFGSASEQGGRSFLLDFDLALLYGVETRVLKQVVRRNKERFPDEFMFQFSKEEWNMLIASCDNLSENIEYGQKLPFAFSEQGVAILNTVLRSKKAIEVSISILRAFEELRLCTPNYNAIMNEYNDLENELILFKNERINF